MVKVAGPAFSMDASGKLGGALVFSKWKGRNYIRSLVKPANPQSGGQVGMRSMFRFLSQNWAALTTVQKATWDDLADAGIISPFNAFMQQNQARWRNFLTPTISWPATESGTAALTPTIVATGGLRQVSIAYSTATINDNWGLNIFRDPVTAFTPAWTNCVQSVLFNTTGGATWVDTPLDPGTYYYRYMTFTDDGVKDLIVAEDSAVVT